MNGQEPEHFAYEQNQDYLCLRTNRAYIHIGYTNTGLVVSMGCTKLRLTQNKLAEGHMKEKKTVTKLYKNNHPKGLNFNPRKVN